MVLRQFGSVQFKPGSGRVAPMSPSQLILLRYFNGRVFIPASPHTNSGPNMNATMLDHTGSRESTKRVQQSNAAAIGVAARMARICPKFAERDPDLGQTMRTGACSKFDEICTLYEYPAELEIISHAADARA
ncbi:hypothetical protein CO674_33165 [Rhizobium hidalgonense]|uniref:Uncharacterized protein n=1 Tax=Rhizobium hidalgonense TaxID=1538159 RepID=A0ABX4JHT7_9HYPH|nr:hypothetical protein CO674_33165 [Rhizobium hidalgonense]PON04998.1 hypothetical protein ATY29_24050 [Rhizobium hidalgonense]